MPFWLVLKAFIVILIIGFPRQSLSCSDEDHKRCYSFPKIIRVEKRSLLTFPPDSLLQINIGLALTGHLVRNTADIILAFQQNAPLPNETQALFVTGRKFSIHSHLREVMVSYGFNASKCLEKMICQVGETPLFGGLLEDLINFILSNFRPSKHRAIRYGDVMDETDSLLVTEVWGKFGKNCSVAFPQCERTPLDFISTIIHF